MPFLIDIQAAIKFPHCWTCLFFRKLRWVWHSKTKFPEIPLRLFAVIFKHACVFFGAVSSILCSRLDFQTIHPPTCPPSEHLLSIFSARHCVLHARSQALVGGRILLDEVWVGWVWGTVMGRTLWEHGARELTGLEGFWKAPQARWLSLALKNAIYFQKHLFRCLIIRTLTILYIYIKKIKTATLKQIKTTTTNKTQPSPTLHLSSSLWWLNLISREKETLVFACLP